MINERFARGCSCMYTIAVQPVIPGVSTDKQGHFPDCWIDIEDH